MKKTLEYEGDTLQNKSFCITGALNKHTRNDYIKWIKERGGSYTKSVTYGTDFLVTNTPDSGTRKNWMARQKGVKIISEKDLLNMVNKVAVLRAIKDL